MARLIDADLAIAKVKDDGILGCGYSDIERIDDVCDMIDSCPTVDAVEVVRCKDCKHYDKTHLDNGDRRMCTKFLGLTIPKPDDFCSYGERKDNGV